MAQHQRTVEIRQFITHQVTDHPRDIARIVAEHFGLSRQAASSHLRAMQASGALQSAGRTKAKTWALVPRASFAFDLPLDESLAEDVVWREHIKPHVTDMPPGILRILSYAFTEMLNNVIDHSGSTTVTIRGVYTAESVDIQIIDRGVGIFRKIKQALGLGDDREAILELAKGKLTTDPVNHTGEGIFFTSRMCDLFAIWSGSLFFTHIRPDSSWLIEADHEPFEGTSVRLVVSLKSDLDIKELFDRFTNAPDDLSFSKTHVPVKLAKYDLDSLVSRSQARRVLSRFERFSQVILDFSGVDFVGQPFADEIFRVFRNERPDIKVVAINTNEFVSRMIQRAQQHQQEHDNQMKLF